MIPFFSIIDFVLLYFALLFIIYNFTVLYYLITSFHKLFTQMYVYTNIRMEKGQ